MTNAYLDIKAVFLAPEPVEAICNNRLLSFVVHELEGAEHPHYHAEGDAWEHTKLVIRNILDTPDHDWLDVLIALFHDVGKKLALHDNNFKNMAGHELYSVEFYNKWCYETNFNIPGTLNEEVRWVILNHMKAHHLHEHRSTYDVMDMVTCPWFPRLARLTAADCLSTLEPDGTPHDNFDAVLKSPKVARWLGKPRPLPIVSAEDFSYECGVKYPLAYRCAEFGLKLQLNGNLTNPQHIKNGVLNDHEIKKLIAKQSV